MSVDAMTDTDRAIAVYRLWRQARVWKLTFFSLVAFQIAGFQLVAFLLPGWLLMTMLITHFALLIAIGVMWNVALFRFRKMLTTLTQMPCPDCGFPLPQDDDTESRAPCPECGKPHSTVSAREVWQSRIPRG
jgi:endogenous inhibitor of DNA gyrase (YacG/DUF329 family)